MKTVQFIITNIIGMLFTFVTSFTVSGQEQALSFGHQLQGGKLPWTSEPRIDPSGFRFVVTGDLTGGEMPGMFAYAVDRINELAPDFVITVGDIIEGYTTGHAEIERQWDHLSQTLSRLEAPFFFVAGNHDVTNNLLLDAWKFRWGYHYYSFHIGGILFVVLNTEEPGENGFSADQIAYVLSVMSQHPAGNQVFVFMHDPFWNMEGKNGFSVMDSVFRAHNTMVFSGHEHRYQHRVYNGKKHYVLAGMAGDTSRMRGPSLGEFNNLMQVTVKDGRTHISNIDLAGLLPPDVVDESVKKQVDILNRGNWARLRPTVTDKSTGSDFSTVLTLTNNGDYVLEITGCFNPAENINFNPMNISELLNPGESIDIPVKMEMPEPLEIHQLPRLSASLTGRFLQENKSLQAKSNPVWEIDHVRHSSLHRNDNQEFSWLTPAVIEESWDWSGPDDAGLGLIVSHDEQNVYISVKIHDDIVTDGSDALQTSDRLRVFLSTDTAWQSMNYYVLEFEPSMREATFTQGSAESEKVLTRFLREGNSLEAVVVMDRTNLKSNSFRLNMAYSDVDNPENMDNAVLWWRPKWGSSRDYPRSGIFILNDE
jgi:hypothetical protein